MYTIKRTEAFSHWFGSLKDKPTRQRLSARLRKAMLGNLGDVKPVGDGVWEMRESLAPAGACTMCNGVTL